MSKMYALQVMAMLMANNHRGPYSFIEKSKYRPKEEKNKYNLSEEEIQQMSDMSPKEKKEFLKGRK